MSEGRTRTIPLRRSRNAHGAEPPLLRQWRERLGDGARLLAAPPRQLWLAALGSTALTVRATHALWSRIVSEGESAERWLRGPRISTPDSRS